ncbi:MAG: CDP-alcohol phosphatidyltransferase family protein [Bacteroidota bacterium]
MTEARRLVARWIGWSPVPIWGTAPVERLRRSLARAGVWDAGPWTGRVPPEGGAVLLLRGDHVYDDALMAALVETPDLVVVRGDGLPVAAHVPRDRAEEIAASLSQGRDPPVDLPRRRGRDVVAPVLLRRRARPGPLVMPVSAELKEAVENRLFAIASPATTDVVARVVWPRPARALARFAAGLRLSPNHVSWISLMLAVLAALLFHAGVLGAGLLAAWSMSLVDAVDGKLARLTLSFSQVGAGLGRALALLHPPLWWWAWWAGGGGDAVTMAVLVAGSLAIPGIEALFVWRHGFPLHEWRRFDSLFRLVAANRNILLLSLSAGWLIGKPDMGFRGASFWLLATLAVLALRLAQAWRSPPESWLAERDWKAAEPPPI